MTETPGVKLVREGKVEMEDWAECQACGYESYGYEFDDTVCSACGNEDLSVCKQTLFDEVAWAALPAAEAMGWVLYAKVVKHGVPRAVIVKPTEEREDV